MDWIANVALAAAMNKRTGQGQPPAEMTAYVS